MRTLLLLGLFSQCAIALAQTTSPHWPLRQIYGQDAVILQLRKEAVAEVCPTDDCLRFVLQDGNGAAIAHDFAFLYLWLVENYDLAPRKDAKGERFVVMILNARKGNCAGADEETVGRCVLTRMAQTYRFTGIETKFEKGWRHTRAFDLAARLRQAGVAR